MNVVDKLIALPVNIVRAIVEAGAVIAWPLYCIVQVYEIKEKKVLDGFLEGKDMLNRRNKEWETKKINLMKKL